MSEPHVIHALVRKRAELSGDIETTQAALRKMILDLEYLDRTLLMFDPDYRGLRRSSPRRSGRLPIGRSAAK